MYIVQTNLICAPVMFCAFLINVVVRADGLAKFVAHYHARALCAWTACEKHDTSASTGESSL